MKSIKIIIFALSFFSLAEADEFIRRPPPADPVFLDKLSYGLIKAALPKLPAIHSETQKKDEAILREFQRTRTEAQCQQALGEVQVNLESLFAKNNGPLTTNEVKSFSPIFNQISNDVNYYTEQLKVDYPRDRPFLYITGLVPCVPKETTKAYPSGHATISRVTALILSDVFPDRREVFLKRSEQIATNRVLAGMHHPSDIESGKALAPTFYQLLLKSPKFQEALAKAKGSK